MSRIRANNIVNGAGTGAPTFPNGAIISGIATINADIDSNSNLTANQITSLQSIGVGTGATVTNPADNELAFNTNGSERLRIDSSGNIGIGTDNPSTNIHIYDSSQPTIRLDRSDAPRNNFVAAWNADELVLAADHDNGGNASRIRFFVDSDEKVRIDENGNIVMLNSGTGIDFSATSDATGMTSELLDDYEEGTFTMTLSAGGNTSNQECRYTKIGRIVYIDGHGDQEINNFFNTGSNTVGDAVTITTNLPFTPVRTGAAPITVSRTIQGSNGFRYERMYVGWRKDSATIYLGSEGNNYYPFNNVVIDNSQTNKTILFSGYFVTEV